MKVLIIGGHSTPSVRGQWMIDLLLNDGHDIVYETVQEVEERQSRANFSQVFTVYDELSSITHIDKEYNRRKAKGPRGRWGKLK